MRDNAEAAVVRLLVATPKKVELGSRALGGPPEMAESRASANPLTSTDATFEAGRSIHVIDTILGQLCLKYSHRISRQWHGGYTYCVYHCFICKQEVTSLDSLRDIRLNDTNHRYFYLRDPSSLAANYACRCT